MRANRRGQPSAPAVRFGGREAAAPVVAGHAHVDTSASQPAQAATARTGPSEQAEGRDMNAARRLEQRLAATIPSLNTVEKERPRSRARHRGGQDAVYQRSRVTH
jgi:hypothetical protein